MTSNNKEQKEEQRCDARTDATPTLQSTTTFAQQRRERKREGEEQFPTTGRNPQVQISVLLGLFDAFLKVFA